MTRGERKAWLADIENVLGDIEHILCQAPDLRRELPSELKRHKHGAGQPPTEATLRYELTALRILRSWLHTRWIEQRGEPVFSQGAEKLAAAGYISAPAKPKRRGRGRPIGNPTASALLQWTDFFEWALARVGRHPIKRRLYAYQMAQELINIQKGTASSANEANVRRQRRRLKNSV